MRVLSQYVLHQWVIVLARGGGDIYNIIAEKYLQMYNTDNIKFISITKQKIGEKIIHYEPMSQTNLDIFYKNNVDIIINPERGVAPNGFPLGIEAMLNGILIFTTDHHNSNKLNDFNYGEEMFIFNLNEQNFIDNIINRIHFLHENKQILNCLSIEIQRKTLDIVSYENTFLKIVDFVENNLEKT